jgi:hypothetical protein
MGKRRSFRMLTCETLEERMVLSHGGASAALAGVTATSARAVNVFALPPVPFVGPIGTLGDSYTDEYRFYTPDRSTARNWVEILHSLRGVSFGPFSLKSRGEPRDQGFAYNWARSDATSVDMINNQLPGLTAQVAAGKVQYAWIFIGGNDFLHLLDAAAAGQIPPANLPAAVQATTAQLELNFLIATETLLAANPNVKLVVSTLPDISATPAAQLAAANNPLARQLLQGISLATASYNNEIAAIAASSNRIALVDLAAVTKQTAQSPTGTISFGGQTIDLITPSDEWHHFFLADTIHVGTVGQGIIADEFALSIDQKFGAQLFPPSPQEIVRFAAVIYNHATHSHTPVPV